MIMLGASGGLGKPFKAESPRDNGSWKIGAIKTWRDKIGISAIEICWVNGTGQSESRIYGEPRGSDDQFVIGDRDHLVRITGSVLLGPASPAYSFHVSSLRFFTREGNSFAVIAMESKHRFEYDEIPGYHIIDLFGRVNSSYLDALGVVIELLPPSRSAHRSQEP